MPLLLFILTYLWQYGFRQTLLDFNQSEYDSPFALSFIFMNIYELNHNVAVFTTQHYASAVYAVVMCPSVHHTSVLYHNG